MASHPSFPAKVAEPGFAKLQALRLSKSGEPILFIVSQVLLIPVVNVAIFKPVPRSLLDPVAAGVGPATM